MKIAIIIDAWFPVIGGSQTHVWELSSRLVKSYGCEIDIFTRALTDDVKTIYSQNEEHFNGRLRIIRVKPATGLANICGRILTVITIAGKVIKENKNKNYDLIHAHSILGGLIGRVVKAFTRKQLLFTVHGSPNLDRGHKNFDYYIEKLILTRIKYDHIISVGKKYQSYINVNKKITNIPNGVSLELFQVTDNLPKANYFKILFVGRLDWPKGLDYLIDAIKLLRDNNSSLINREKIQIHIIGYGFQETKYKARVDSYDLNQLIKFRGKITGKNLIKEYKNSHLFILPSICEGQPITFLEAMASKLPILTTYGADNAEIIDNEIGWKVESENIVSLADKIVEIMQLPEKSLQAMGLKGYQKVAENYSLEIIAKETFHIYSDLT